MERYGTLKSPFDPEYLVSVLEESGFEDMSRFAAVDELLTSRRERTSYVASRSVSEFPPMNTVIAVNPVSAELRDADAQFAVRSRPRGLARSGR